MVKCQETIINACELFLRHNKIDIGYPNEFAKKFGYKKIILVNKVKVPKKMLGYLIFMDVEKRQPFAKKWATLNKDLALQVLSML